MKFNPKTHTVGKTYDLTQDNMTAMILEIDKLQNDVARLEEELDATLLALYITRSENDKETRSVLED